MDRIAARTARDRRAVHAAWAPVADEIVAGLGVGREVDLLGLARLRLVWRPERAFTHPLTGQELILPAERVVVFLPDPALVCAANPAWTESEAAEAVDRARPEPWEERPVLRAIDRAPAADLADALIDEVIEAVLAAAAAGEERALVLDGLGALRLEWRDGWIDLDAPGGPRAHRGRWWPHLEAGLALRAALVEPAGPA